MKCVIRSRLAGLVALVFMLAACSTKSIVVPEDHWARPFKDTRLQYALLTNDSQMLQQDFLIKEKPVFLTRVLAGFHLPITAPMDVILYPVYTTVAFIEDTRPKNQSMAQTVR